MKHTSSIIISFLILLLTPSAYGCSCVLSKSSFVQLTKRSELVIRGRVIEYVWHKDDRGKKRTPLAMTIEVKEVYKGAAKLGKIVVWGDNGMQCRPYVTKFPIKTEWILALSKDPSTAKGELAVSACGEYWLQVKGSNVVEKVMHRSPKAKPKVMSLPDFHKLLKAST
jgi:hypothetical protein